MNAYKCPRVGVGLTKLKKLPTCFCLEITFLSLLANAYPF